MGAVVMRGGQDEDGAEMAIDGPGASEPQVQQGMEPRQAKRRRIYEDHMPMSEVTAGIKAGRLHQVRMSPDRMSAMFHIRAIWIWMIPQVVLRNSLRQASCHC